MQKFNFKEVMSIIKPGEVYVCDCDGWVIKEIQKTEFSVNLVHNDKYQGELRINDKTLFYKRDAIRTEEKEDANENSKL